MTNLEKDLTRFGKKEQKKQVKTKEMSVVFSKPLNAKKSMSSDLLKLKNRKHEFLRGTENDLTPLNNACLRCYHFFGGNKNIKNVKKGFGLVNKLRLSKSVKIEKNWKNNTHKLSSRKYDLSPKNLIIDSKQNYLADQFQIQTQNSKIQTVLFVDNFIIRSQSLFVNKTRYWEFAKLETKFRFKSNFKSKGLDLGKLDFQKSVKKKNEEKNQSIGKTEFNKNIKDKSGSISNGLQEIPTISIGNTEIDFNEKWNESINLNFNLDNDSNIISNFDLISEGQKIPENKTEEKKNENPADFITGDKMVFSSSFFVPTNNYNTESNFDKLIKEKKLSSLISMRVNRNNQWKTIEEIDRIIRQRNKTKAYENRVKLEKQKQNSVNSNKLKKESDIFVLPENYEKNKIQKVKVFKEKIVGKDFENEKKGENSGSDKQVSLNEESSSFVRGSEISKSESKPNEFEENKNRRIKSNEKRELKLSKKIQENANCSDQILSFTLNEKISLVDYSNNYQPNLNNSHLTGMQVDNDSFPLTNLFKTKLNSSKEIFRQKEKMHQNSEVENKLFKFSVNGNFKFTNQKHQNIENLKMETNKKKEMGILNPFKNNSHFFGMENLIDNSDSNIFYSSTEKPINKMISRSRKRSRISSNSRTQKKPKNNEKKEKYSRQISLQKIKLKGEF